eukprot:gene5040-8636_t
MLKTFLKKNYLKKPSLIFNKKFYSQDKSFTGKPLNTEENKITDVTKEFEQPINIDTSKSQFLNNISNENKEKIENLLEPIYENEEVSNSIFSTIWSYISPVQGFEYVLTTIHESGLPWFATISLTALTFKILLLPVVITTMKNSARLQTIQSELQLLNQRIKESMKNPKEQLYYRSEVKNLYKKHNTSPFKSLLGGLFQVPIFISYFITLRGMNTSVESFKEGGLLWFTDLTLADPTYILPFISTFLVFMNMELSRMMGGSQMQIPSKFTNIMKWGLRGVMLLSFPFICRFETSFMVYWITTNLFTCFQTFFLNLPIVKEKLGIPINSKSNIDPKKNDVLSKILNIGKVKKEEKIYNQSELHKIKKNKK